MKRVTQHMFFYWITWQIEGANAMKLHRETYNFLWDNKCWLLPRLWFDNEFNEI
jgi:hypothetical protein